MVDYNYRGPSKEEMLADLTKANGFTEADLAQNRAGKISDAQFLKLVRQALRPVLGSGGTLLGWLLFSWIIREFVPDILQFFMFKYAVAGYWAITIGAVCSFLIGLATSSQLTYLLALDLRAGKSAFIEGRASASWEERLAQGTSRLWGEKEAVYNYVIKNEFFEVSHSAWVVLHSKYDQFTPKLKLHYSPMSKMLLSVEPCVTADSAKEDNLTQTALLNQQSANFKELTI